MPLSDFLGIREQYYGASAAAPPATVEQDYSQVAQSAPQSHWQAAWQRHSLPVRHLHLARCWVRFLPTRMDSNAPAF